MITKPPLNTICSSKAETAASSLSLYLHFPYCWSKCHYCAFNSIRYDKIQSLRFLSSLKSEIGRYAGGPGFRDKVLSTIFMGGGTPSIFAADQILDVLEHCRRHWSFSGDIEITMEANPGTVNAEKLEALREGGVNRLSLGVQSFRNAELESLGRAHNAQTAREAYRMAREAGFSNINLDFMYALERQHISEWSESLTEAVDLAPDHLSAYALIIEKETRFGTESQNGRVFPCEEDQIPFDELTEEVLALGGYRRYEVSNYARPGRESRHNLVYWGQDEYLGLGPGAHSFLAAPTLSVEEGLVRSLVAASPQPSNDSKCGDPSAGWRFSKVADIERYIGHVDAGQHAVESCDAVSTDMALREAVIFGLRKTEGILLEEVIRRFPASQAEVLGGVIRQWEREGWMILEPPHLRLSSRGLRLWDRMAEEIIALD